MRQTLIRIAGASRIFEDKEVHSSHFVIEVDRHGAVDKGLELHRPLRTGIRLSCASPDISGYLARCPQPAHERAMNVSTREGPHRITAPSAISG